MPVLNEETFSQENNESYECDDILCHSYDDKISKVAETDDSRRPAFAPQRIPLERRLQTLAVLWHTCTIPLILSFFFICCSLPQLWPLMFVYFVFFFLNDRTPSNGNSVWRYSSTMRNLAIWKYFVNYFPIRIRKSVDLKPTFTTKQVSKEVFISPFGYLPRFLDPILAALRIPKTQVWVSKQVKTGPRYIFAYHPHGIISMGVTGAFATNGAGFEKLFPGIRVFLLTLNNQFRLPFYRDYLMSLGISSVSKHNVMSLVRQNESVAIVVGGASESLLAKPGKNDIVLKKRKGFVKIALELGDVSLVPIYGFGETNIYNVFETSGNRGEVSDSFFLFRKALYSFQMWLKNRLGFTIPLFFARGVFNYDFGLLPFRKPINIVVGSPVSIPFMPSPSQQQIDYYHDLYVKELKKLFDEHKSKYLLDGDAELRIVQ
ncbi:unnamed protein product [Kuraishia capsulata CBS 1993]|uniref:Diacylglycerol O-acyltransferase n=1 Tax=Kuraishia capsulata CBS 1993 TaxID=1382522 RepID=W6MNX4_9ASCO|nr:uncharacterized protein KUCA_T00002736001 [Kuraishia capsulata CBS 1993]CDK26762.1 unnamed protein product [Kuraishia capsulata CBS 1993]